MKYMKLVIPGLFTALLISYLLTTNVKIKVILVVIIAVMAVMTLLSNLKFSIECECHGMDALCENCGGKGKYPVGLYEWVLIKLAELRG